MDEMGFEWWINLQFQNFKTNERLQLEKTTDMAELDFPENKIMLPHGLCSD